MRYIVNATGFRLDAAPINIVSDPAASDPTVRTGLSCFGCHTEGMNTFEDQVRTVIESNTNPTYNKAQALRLYVEESEIDVLLQEDIEKYRGALEETGGAFGDIEPISRFHEAFQGTVDAAYAAAVVGLKTETFLEKIRENVRLQNAGLLVLDSQNGSVKRDVWTSSFPDILFALNFPTLVVTPPEQKPGTAVQIPDPNLRTAIIEKLGKSPNALITVAEMERLEKLDVPNREIQDLTGLQFATNLERLYLDNNQVFDLSPLAGLTTLEHLEVCCAQVSDLTPLAGLTGLSRLDLHDNSISSLSPLAGLTELAWLDLDNNSISNLSPLAGLTELAWLDLDNNSISNLSPLAGLTGLNRLDLEDNSISNLSPLAGLTELAWLDLDENSISNLSPLAELINLKWLRVADNSISDVTPLAKLTGLNWLGIYNNEISDISPLDKLRENTELVWYGNPVFPTDAPKIEGPWLWVVLPYKEPRDDKDLLSEASGGTATETDIATHGAVEDRLSAMTCGPFADSHLRGQPTLTGCFKVVLMTPCSTVLCPSIHHGNRTQRYTLAAITVFRFGSTEP